MANKSIRRVDAKARMDDALNLIADRDKGKSGDNVVWRFDSGSIYALDADNPSGLHANFGSGILSIQDAGITAAVSVAITGDIAVTGNIAWKSGTTHFVTLDHAVTVDRTVTVQNVDGTMAILGASENAGGNLLFTDNTYDIGASGASRPRDLFLARNQTIGGTLQVTGVTTLLANLLFSTDNTLDIGASGATRPRDLFLGRNLVVGGTSTVTGNSTFTGTLSVNGEAIAKAPVNGPLGSNYTLTNSYADLSGCSVSLTPGNWLLTLVCDFQEQGAGDLNQAFLGKIVVGTATATITNSSAVAVFTPQVASERATVVQIWPVNVTVAGTIKAQAEKTGGTGTSIAVATDTALTAVFVGKP